MRREPVRVRLIQDCARALFLIMLLGVPAVVAWAVPPRPLDAAVRAGAAVLSHLLVLGLLRRLIPRAPAGDHLVAPWGPYLLQAISRALVEVATLPLFRGPLWFFHWGRVLHLDLLGARVAWDVALPLDLIVRDPAHLSIGGGSVLEPGVVLAATSLRAGRAHLAPVRVGEGCVIGSQVVLLPGVSVAHEVRVEPGALLADDVQVGVSAVIGPGARLSRGVVVGAHASIGAGAVLGEGVTLGERSRVRAGAFVPPGTQIGDHARFPDGV